MMELKWLCGLVVVAILVGFSIAWIISPKYSEEERKDAQDFKRACEMFRKSIYFVGSEIKLKETSTTLATLSTCRGGACRHYPRNLSQEYPLRMSDQEFHDDFYMGCVTGCYYGMKYSNGSRLSECSLFCDRNSKANYCGVRSVPCVCGVDCTTTTTSSTIPIPKVEKRTLQEMCESEVNAKCEWIPRYNECLCKKVMMDGEYYQYNIKKIS